MHRCFRPLIILFLPCVAPLALADARVPAYVLELPDSVQSVFVADASDARIYRFEHAEDNGLRLAGESYMSIGSKGVGKTRAWDRKTPLGVYFVTEQLDTSTLHEKYGVTAFPLDYPNAWDRRNNRTGYGVWVHGVEGDERRPPLDTDGCLALPNANLAAMQTEFEPFVTPVVVSGEMRWISEERAEALRQGLREAVLAWARSLATADLPAYLAMYSEDFSYRGMRRPEWASFRLQAFAEGPAGDVQVNELLLLADPSDEGLFLSRFRQGLTLGGRTRVTTKRLYWRLADSGEFRIVAEDGG